MRFEGTLHKVTYLCNRITGHLRSTVTLKCNFNLQERGGINETHTNIRSQIYNSKPYAGRRV